MFETNSFDEVYEGPDIQPGLTRSEIVQSAVLSQWRHPAIAGRTLTPKQQQYLQSRVAEYADATVDEVGDLFVSED